MFLFGSVILARARDRQPEYIAIKLQTRFRVSDDDRRVIDTEKQSILSLPLRVALVCGKLQDLQPVFVRIAKVECLDAACVFVPIGKTLRASGSVFDLILAQQRVRFIHIAGDDRDVLEPAIVTARINRHWTALRRQILSQFDKFLAQLHAHHAHAQSKHSLQSLIIFARDFNVRNFFERQDARVKVD